MRIVLIAGVFPPNRFGSPAVVAEQTAIGLSARGHDVFVVTGADDLGGGTGMSRWEVSRIPVVGIGVSPDEQGPRTDDAGVARRVGQVLRAVRPDIVHAHSARFLGHSPARLAQQLGLPTVISVYGGESAWPAQTLAAADAVLVGVPGQRGDLIMSGLDPAAVRVVVNGAAPAATGWRHPEHDGPLRIGFLGGMSQALGYGVVQDALNTLRRTDYELHVVDPATARGVRAIREWDFKVPGLVRLLARFPPPVRDRYFGSIDVLLALPQDPDSACLSVREALLRGVWPIVSNVEAAAQVVVDGKNGTLVRGDSASDVARAVGWAIDHRAELAVARDADAPARPIPTIDDQVAALENIYAELLGRHPL